MLHTSMWVRGGLCSLVVVSSLFFALPIVTANDAIDVKPFIEPGDLKITELMAENEGIVKVESAEGVEVGVFDWIEIENVTNQILNLQDVYFSIDPSAEFQFSPPPILMLPGEKKVFWIYLPEAAPVVDNVPVSIPNGISGFDLNNTGGYIGLYTFFGEKIDEVTYEEHLPYMSYGIPMGESEFRILATPTPGEENVGVNLASPFTVVAGEITEELTLNEVLPRNDTVLADIYGEYDDAIEIYNPTDAFIDMSGLYLSDNKDLLTKYQIPEGIIIPPRGYVVFWADNEPEQGILHTNFKIKGGGDDVYLTREDGETIISSVEFGDIATDTSLGLIFEGNTWTKYLEPTLWKKNDGPALTLPAVSLFDTTSLSHIKSQPYSVVLNAPQTNNITPTIYYTKDASTPTEFSFVYQTWLDNYDSVVVRAIAKAGDGYESSNVLTKSYFYNFESTLPIASIVTAAGEIPSDILNTTPEQPVHLEYFNPEGIPLFNLDAGIKPHGGWGSGELMNLRSFRIHAKKKYGQDSIDYPIFGSKNIDSFKRLLFRGASQDGFSLGNYGSHLRDSFYSRLSEGTNTMGTAVQPINLFFNGTYTGIYNLRERIDEKFVSSNYDVDADDVIVIEEKTDSQSYQGFLDSLEYASFETPVAQDTLDIMFYSQKDTSAFQQLFGDAVDVENHIDYSIIGLYTNNIDWPRGNVEYWKNIQNDGPLQWILNDGDLTLKSPESNSFEFAIVNQDDIDSQADDAGYSTWGVLMGSFLENTTFRHQYINRYADMLNTHLSSDSAISLIDEMAAILEPEIPKHIDAAVYNLNQSKTSEEWHTHWENEVQKIRDYLTVRPDYVREHIVSYFEDAAAEKELTFILSQSCGNSTLDINTLTLNSETNTLEGTYFEGIPITVTAHPGAGVTFVGWTDASLPKTTTITVDPADVSHIEPIFVAESHLKNVSADNGIEAWKTEAISIENFGGNNYFQMGSANSLMQQELSVGCGSGPSLESGEYIAWLTADGFTFGGGSKNLVPTVGLTFIDGNGENIGQTYTATAEQIGWNILQVEALVPVQTKAIRIQAYAEHINEQSVVDHYVGIDNVSLTFTRKHQYKIYADYVNKWMESYYEYLKKLTSRFLPETKEDLETKKGPQRGIEFTKTGESEEQDEKEDTSRSRYEAEQNTTDSTEEKKEETTQEEEKIEQRTRSRSGIR